jgi:hypothetical protein
MKNESAGGDAGYYAIGDFGSVSKIDMHVHINAFDPIFIEQAERDGFRLLTVNVEYSDFPPLDEQLHIANALRRHYPDRVSFATTFTMQGWGEPGWQERTIDHLEKTVADGACAVKFWKNIGMEFRDRDGRLVMIDDPGFDPIFAWISKRNIPVIGHIGEPRDCWLPLNRIEVKYIKEYFATHPQYHMYLQPGMPSYEAQLESRDARLLRNQGLPFVGAHLASLEWSVAELGTFLDRFPSAVVDLAARVGDLQHQTAKNRGGVRDFFIRYQDRLMYATDMMWHRGGDATVFQKELHEKWLEDWRFLCTDDTRVPPDLAEQVTGLQLPRPVIDKLYRHNAAKFFRLEA